MVPVCENEILVFFGESQRILDISGESQDNFRPYISAFNPAKLELKDIHEQQNYKYCSD